MRTQLVEPTNTLLHVCLAPLGDAKSQTANSAIGRKGFVIDIENIHVSPRLKDVGIEISSLYRSTFNQRVSADRLSKRHLRDRLGPRIPRIVLAKKGRRLFWKAAEDLYHRL